MVILTVHQGKNPGKTFEVDPPVTFGRDHDQTDVTITDPRVSRKHGRITREDGHYFIEDLDSSNGTHVNGISTHRSRIVNGDLIQVGDTELLFQVGESAEMAGEQKQEEEAVPAAVEDEPIGADEQEQVNLPEWVYSSGLVLLVLVVLGGVGFLSYLLVNLLISVIGG